MAAQLECENFGAEKRIKNARIKPRKSRRSGRRRRSSRSGEQHYCHGISLVRLAYFIRRISRMISINSDYTNTDNVCWGWVK